MLLPTPAVVSGSSQGLRAGQAVPDVAVVVRRRGAGRQRFPPGSSVCPAPAIPVTLPSVAARMRVPVGAFAWVGKLTVPVVATAPIVTRRSTGADEPPRPTAVILSVSVSVLPLPSRQPQVAVGVHAAAEAEVVGRRRSSDPTSENIPNWKTGIATASIVRTRCTSPPVAVLAVTSS